LQEKELINSCLKGESAGFNELYKRFAPKMLVVCMRYVSDGDDAKDLLQDGFIKVFVELHRFKNEGSLEGWIRRIMVNIALNNYKKTIKISHITDDISLLKSDVSNHENEDIENFLSNEELLKLVQSLTPAYRMVFNLYVFEGFKHNEIAEKLGIKEGTSKSNLQDARIILQKKIIAISKEAKQHQS
jgi:RNA polymerase sigma-70 factor, ECF subfamily